MPVCIHMCSFKTPVSPHPIANSGKVFAPACASDCLQAAQDKGNHPRGLQQDDLAKRSGTTAWQQQRLQLRAVMSPSGSPSAQSGSPSGFRYADASVDTLQQQRAKLRPVQTSKQAVLPTQQGFVAPVMRPGGAARPKEAQPLPAATAGVFLLGFQPTTTDCETLTDCMCCCDSSALLSACHSRHTTL